MATKVSTLLSAVRKKIRDTTTTEYPNEELIDCLNEAIDYMSSFLIRINDAEMIASKEVADGSITKPDNFDSFVGAQMLYMEGDTIKTLSGSTATMRYYATKDHVSVTTDSNPFKASIDPLLIELTAIYALNRNEFDATQDIALFEKHLGLLQGGGS
ncbi:MAG: hypothetical protein H6Q67_2214 [Firmicutes bacterium]|nr:hypothetical protein [Bacillota bacterium]